MLKKYQSNRERLKRCWKMNELMESWMKVGGDATLNNFYLIKWASENKFPEILEFLIKWATENGNEEMVNLLIKAGADIQLYNSYFIHVSV